ncbi:MAG: exosortase/archaeosortase family protein [Chloroflexota bacterium]|nr:exosortase/archaeosortase family protein [Chloroflexota bacterium]
MSETRTRYFIPELALSDVARPLSLVVASGAIALLVMPMFATFGELLTDVAMLSGVDAVLGRTVAPAEAQVIHGLLALLGLASAARGPLLSIGDGTRTVTLYISWNCVGWQTLIFLALTLPTGLHGRHTTRSKLEVLALGVFGILLLNVLRITVVGLVALRFGQLPAVVVHDYGSVVATVVFLMAFWTVAYDRILEPAEARDGKG